MGIYLPNMEMPKTCWDCACSIYYEIQDKAMCDITDETLDYILWKRERRPNCPLIEIPTPHGRLIDADKLVRNTIYNKYITETILSSAPTVIEAEGETE